MKIKYAIVWLTGVCCFLPAIHALAMTDQQANALALAAHKGNSAALAQLTQAASAGDAAAEFGIGEYYLWQSNYSYSNTYFRKAAAGGDAEAENNLGISYFDSRGVPPNPTNLQTSVYWYRKAADQGYMPAEYNLGDEYYNGLGVARDYGRAVYWWRNAALQGYARAELGMGDAYYSGSGVPKDTSAALAWWSKAAAQGGSLGKTAQQNITAFNDRSIEKTEKQSQAPAMTNKQANALAYAANSGNNAALAQLSKAARAGDVGAEYGLAEYCLWRAFYSPGLYPLAHGWFQRAAAAGDALAESDLGFMYLGGQGLPQNYGLALKWFQKAANQGNATGEQNLAYMYFFGYGVAKNYTTALYWYKKAAAQGWGEGEVAEHNNAYQSLQIEKLYQAQQAAAKAAAEKNGLCAIHFTVQNNSDDILKDNGPIFTRDGSDPSEGIYVCFEEGCSGNFLDAPSQDGEINSYIIPPGSQQSFDLDPTAALGWTGDLRRYYVKFVIPSVNMYNNSVKVDQFTSSWYPSCDKPVINVH